MKKNTWIMVMIALGLTCGIVGAKTLLTKSVPTIASAMEDDIAFLEPVATFHPAPPVTQSSPERITPMAPASQSEPTIEQQEEIPWTVKVVHGTREEYVTYPSAHERKEIN